MKNKKGYLLEGNKVKWCDYNIAKMNPYEYTFKRFFRKKTIIDYLNCLKSSFMASLDFFANIINLFLFIIFMPVYLFIIFPILAKKEIKQAKEDIQKVHNFQSQYLKICKNVGDKND